MNSVPVFLAILVFLSAFGIYFIAETISKQLKEIRTQGIENWFINLF